RLRAGQPGAPAAGQHAAATLNRAARSVPGHFWRHYPMRHALLALVSLGLLLEARGPARSDFLYWTNLGTNDIRRANLDGSGQQILIGGLPGPSGIALDVSAGKIYWTDFAGGDIRRGNLDGTGQQTIVTGLSSPAGIDLDLAGG